MDIMRNSRDSPPRVSPLDWVSKPFLVSRPNSRGYLQEVDHNVATIGAHAGAATVLARGISGVASLASLAVAEGAEHAVSGTFRANIGALLHEGRAGWRLTSISISLGEVVVDLHFMTVHVDQTRDVGGREDVVLAHGELAPRISELTGESGEASVAVDGAKAAGDRTARGLGRVDGNPGRGVRLQGMGDVGLLSTDEGGTNGTPLTGDVRVSVGPESNDDVLGGLVVELEDKGTTSAADGDGAGGLLGASEVSADLDALVHNGSGIDVRHEVDSALLVGLGSAAVQMTVVVANGGGHGGLGKDGGAQHRGSDRGLHVDLF